MFFRMVADPVSGYTAGCQIQSAFTADLMLLGPDDRSFRRCYPVMPERRCLAVLVAVPAGAGIKRISPVFTACSNCRSRVAVGVRRFSRCFRRLCLFRFRDRLLLLLLHLFRKAALSRFLSFGPYRACPGHLYLCTLRCRHASAGICKQAYSVPAVQFQRNPADRQGIRFAVEGVKAGKPLLQVLGVPDDLALIVRGYKPPLIGFRAVSR